MSFAALTVAVVLGLIVAGYFFLWRPALKRANSQFLKSKDEWLHIMSFFDEQLSGPLNSFAERHNLVIDKYHHDSPSWNLHFRHPEGGNASISVARVDDDTISVSSGWYVDNYVKKTRSLKWGDRTTFKLTEKDLEKALLAALELTLSWKPNDLNQQANLKYPWSNYSKDEFEKMDPGRNYKNPIL